MLQLRVLGYDTVVASSLCAVCPHSAVGCCQSPPPLGWSDLGRIVSKGGRDWILEQHRAGNVLLRPFGAYIRRVRGRARDGAGAPRISKCVFHGPTGCTVPETHRPGTCNVYICESALHAGEQATPGSAAQGRAVHADIASRFSRADAELAERIAVEWPDGVELNASFLDWLGQAFTRVPA